MGLINHPMTPLIVKWLEAVNKRAAYLTFENWEAEIAALNVLNAALEKIKFAYQLKYSERASEPDVWKIEWMDGRFSFSFSKPFTDLSAIKVITPLYAAMHAAKITEGVRLSNWLADYSHDLMEDGDLDQEAAEIAKASQWIVDRLIVSLEEMK